MPYRRVTGLRWAAAMGAISVATAAAEPSARAELPEPRASDGITTPDQTVSGTDDASAILVNPANLALGPGPELRFTWLRTGQASPLVQRGYSLDIGLPFWVLGTGLGVDWLRPTGAAPPPFGGPTGGRAYQWIRWPLAIRAGDWAGLGVTLAWSNAEAPQLDGLFSATGGLTVRPSRYLSVAVVARDFNEPRSSTGGSIDPSVDLGATLRPAGGRRLLEVALEASYRSQSERWIPKLALGVDVPYVGRLHGGVELLDAENGQAAASAGLDLNVGPLDVGGGPVFGSALGPDGAGFHAHAAIRTFRERPGLPLPPRVVRSRLDSTPGVREHTHLLARLWRSARDPEVDGVLLELRDEPADSLAHAEELADALRHLRARGKMALCHLEDAGGHALHVCAAADRVAMNPAGGLRFAGLSSRYFYFGGLLEKLGVRADFVRIGAHKLAPEQFALGESSALGRRDHEELLGAFERVVVDAVSRGRGLDPGAVRQRIAGGPYIAPEARDAKLVDELAYNDEIDAFVEQSFGRPVTIRDLDEPSEASPYWRTPPRIAVVYLDGDMIDGESISIPILGIELAGSATIARALKQAREDPSVAAVVFRIESGGGSSLAADVILREASVTAKSKPLVVSMGAKAASGAYYAALAAHEIFANRGTTTGSIGIFYGKVDVVGLLDKLGIRVEAFRSAPRADAESLFRPFTDEERQVLGTKVKQFYDLFVGRVAQGRKLTPAQVHAVGAGRVWSGQQALGHGLIDELGGLRQAVESARALADLPADAPLLELPVEEQSLLEMVLELAGVPMVQAGPGSGSSVGLASGWVPPAVRDIARALAPFLFFESTKPLALMELGSSGP